MVEGKPCNQFNYHYASTKQSDTEVLKACRKCGGDKKVADKRHSSAETVKDNKENKQKAVAMAQAAQEAGNSTASKGNEFQLPTESGAAIDDDCTRAYIAMEQRQQDIQPKEPPQDPDQERTAGWTCAAVASLLTAMHISRREFVIVVIAVAVAVTVVYVGLTFNLQGAEGASVRRGATGTRGINLNAFGMDQ